MLGRIDLILAAILAIASLALGGGDGTFPLGELPARLLACALIARILLGPRRAVLWRTSRGPLMLLLALVGFALLQLVPLPPALWRALPGHGEAARIADLLGAGAAWRPISLDPEATLSSLLSLLPFCALALAAAVAAPRERVLLLVPVAAMAAISALIAALQATGRIDALFPDVDPGYQLGLFANRDHQASLLLVGLVLAGGLAVGGRGRRGPGRAVLAASTACFLVSSILLTQSRAGFALMLLALPAILLYVLPALRMRLWARIAMAGAPLALLAWFWSGNAMAARLVGRLAAAEELRPDIWATTARAVARFLPFGSGLGTFNLVYEQSEAIGALGRGWVPHAHNDYLELLLEGGLPAMLLMLAFFALFLPRLVRLRPVPPAVMERAAGVAAVLLLLQSFVDYPLRGAGLLALFGLLLGTAFAPVASPEARAAQPVAMPGRLDPWGAAYGLTRKGRVAFIHLPNLSRGLAVSAALLFVTLLTLGDGAVSGAVQRGELATALRLNASSPLANGRSAEAEFDEGRFARAEADARRALAPLPIYPRALRSYAFARELQRDVPAARSALLLAGTLGWRDIPTQVWLMLDAGERRDWRAAALHGDAVARQGFGEEVFERLAEMMAEPRGRAQLAQRLASGPTWRGEFIAYLAEAPEAQLPAADLLVSDLMRGGRPLGTAELAPYLERLGASGRWPRARALWLAARRELRPAGALVFDGEFAAAPAREGVYVPAFEWRFSSGLGAQATVDSPPWPGSGAALRAESNGHSAERLAAQTLLLAPGRYRLSFASAAELASASPSLLWRVVCSGSDAVLASVVPRETVGAWSGNAADFTVPAGCPVQELELRARIDVDPAQSISWFDRVAIAPESAQPQQRRIARGSVAATAARLTLR
ncbi:MAG TPA: O-antigen ligase family protein [Allosphingosinicella sp.]